jgi:predicted Fe-S protein YdhL (DUF1289 family)
MKRIATPCVNLCWMNPVLGLCEGCGRTRDELTQWCFMTEDQRLAIMATLQSRLDELRASRDVPDIQAKAG